MTYQLTNAKSQRSDQAHFMLSETDHSNMLVFSTLERWLIHHLGLVYIITIFTNNASEP